MAERVTAPSLHPSSWWARSLSFAACVALWPLSRLGRQRLALLDPLGVRLAVVSILVSLVIARLAPRIRGWGWAGPLVVVVAAVPMLAAGRWALAWSATTALVCAVGIHRLTFGFLRRPLPDVTRVLGLLGVAAGLVGRVAAEPLALVPWASIVSVVVVAVTAPDVAWGLERGVERAMAGVRSFAAATGRALGAVLMWPVAVVVILVPWVVHRVARWDPLGAGAGGRGPWVRRDPWDPVRPTLRWVPEPRGLRTPARTWHGFVVAVTTMALVSFSAWGTWVGLAGDRGGSPTAAGTGRPIEGRAAIEELYAQRWHGGVGGATDDMLDRVRLSQYVGTELPDTRSAHLNVVGGRRASWRPPGGTCPELTVWMFGGSALFGVGQRDGRTVASAVARRAHQLGTGLRVVNWGVPGDVAWQQYRRLERALYDPALTAPDAVVFYDGYNDLYTTGDASVLRWVRPGELVGPLDRLHMRAMDAMSEELAADGSSRRITVDLVDPGAREPGEGDQPAIAQYAAAHDVTGRLLASHGIPFLHVLQPMLDVREPKLRGDPATNAADVARTRRFVRSRPPAVVDLSGAFDGWDRPVFVDGVHTVEAANPVVARALFERLRPLLADARAAKEATCT